MKEQPKRIEKDLLPTIPPPEWEFHTVLGAPHGCMLFPGDQGPVVVRRRVSYGDWEPVRPDRWAEPDVNGSSVVAAEEMHQGPGVYGGLETHRGARHECPAPDCGPQGVQITPNPDGEDSALIHFPEVDYVDTQPWSADIGISTDALRELRDAIDKHLGTSVAKRITDLHAPVQHMGQTWCGECSVRRSTGPRTEEWVAFVPHPCPTIDVLGTVR